MSDLKSYRMLIDGEWVASGDGQTFESINPTTGQPWAEIPAATDEDVDRAVRAAHRAFSEGAWATMLPTGRGKLLRNLGDLLADKSEDLGRTECIDTGKMFRETRWQATYIAEFFHFHAGLADKVTGETLPIDKPDMMTLTTREPLGVIAAVVPWNSQLFLVAVKIGPALAAGNTVVLKASEHASAAMLEFGELIEQAGFPPGVVNIVTGFGEPCGRSLTTHPLVARISFTGGPGTARHIVRNSAENFAEVSLELGGKSPVVVFEDADLESAVNGAMASIFGASGQSCVAGSRIYLHETIHDSFLADITNRAGKIVIGDPLAEETQMGPLCTPGQLNTCKTQVARAIEEGGTVHHGGKPPSHLNAALNAGWFYEPTIVECPDQTMEIVDSEMFGPVLSVLRFRDEDEVIAKANDTRYGLASGIFTRDIGRALRVQKQIRAGIVWINTYRVVSPIAEFGGFKDSGFGRESGAQAIYDYTRPKTVWINTSDAPMGDPFVMR
ncbi:MAG: aldehyde dehydrogenase [Rhodospirillales bacterium]|nr:aldehyde dehydrogenase [Rhodospirillales bacterium]